MWIVDRLKCLAIVKCLRFGVCLFIFWWGGGGGGLGLLFEALSLKLKCMVCAS